MTISIFFKKSWGFQELPQVRMLRPLFYLWSFGLTPAFSKLSCCAVCVSDGYSCTHSFFNSYRFSVSVCQAKIFSAYYLITIPNPSKQRPSLGFPGKPVLQHYILLLHWIFQLSSHNFLIVSLYLREMDKGVLLSLYIS